ncbi:MAG TPA: threonine aldolase family protein [Gaiellaceae bacterium]|jgi:threonine aldolase
MANLFSDSQTVPSQAMLQAMIAAEVGDEQRGTDPTVNALQDRVADLLGHEAALFLPSGTMCNAIAVRLHVRPGGDEIILDEFAHPADSECGGPAALSGATLRFVRTPTGIFSGDDLRALVRPPDRYVPRSRLVIVEQSTNLGGGRVWPAEAIDDVLAVAREHGLRTHLDGARLLNAVVASGVPARRFAADFDTAWIDFSKGLGCPLGAVLAGSRELIDEAWRYKQMWGGAMRQTGYVAAACVYALDHNVERLAEDHDNARLLAEGLAGIPGVDIEPSEVETNIVVFGVADAHRTAAALAAEGVDVLAVDERRLRAVTYLGVTRADVDEALATVARVIRASR